MLEAHDVSYSVGHRRLVDGVTLRVRPGHVLAVLGPNGSGKSTLLRMLSGERKPSAGCVTLDGATLAELPAAQLAARRAVVPQSTVLSFPFTVLECVMLGMTVPGFDLTGVRATETAHEVIRAVGLGGFEKRLFTQLSGGERQRVSVARAMCQLAAAPARENETSVLLLDEPTSSLDLTHQTTVLGLMRKEAHNGRAVVVVLHDLNLAAAFADDIVLMRAGRAVTSGTASSVLTDDLLSKTYGCAVRTNTLPPEGRPFVIPGA
jgi:iron complex transport system ATP-binding protein